MRVVVLILDGIAKDPCGGVMKLSEDIGYYNEVDPILVRQWALTFIQNGGNYAALDIYDNSSGHNCMAIDALNSEKLNIGVGGKNQVIIRQGYYVKDGALKRQYR